MRRPVQGRDFGPAWQTACIKSWKGAGFQVVSLNAPEEIEALRPFAPAVEFKTLPAGRTRPLFADFFTAANSSKSRIVGIINADCMMIPPIGFANRLMDHLDGIVIVERFNLSKETLRPTGVRVEGFDAFFFKAEAAATIARDDHWHIGGVWGDYWLPFAFHFAGFEIKTLPAPILLHLEHDLAWDWSGAESYAPRLINFFRAHGGDRLDPRLAAKLPNPGTLRPDDIYVLHDLLFDWLQSRDPLWKPEAGSADELMITVLNASAKFPQPRRHILRERERALLRGIRALLARVIDALGLRRMLYTLGLVKRRQISS